MNKDELFILGDSLHDKGEFKRAFEVFEQAANKGGTSSMTRISLMYISGEGVQQSYDKSIEWDMKAIECGDTTALSNLAITYRMKGDIRTAKYWFEKALDSGDDGAAIALAKLYLVSDKEIEKVKEYLRHAVNSDSMCEAEDEEAEALLSELEGP